MNDSLLAAYLNDHLAGSVFATDLGEHCKSKHADAALAASLGEPLREIEQDRAVLEEIIGCIGSKPSTVKQASAWISEKIGRLGLRATQEHKVAFVRMQELEALLIGVRGKLALWDVLEPLSAADARLAGFRWEELKRRAEDQMARLNRWRIEAARLAFEDDSQHTN